MLGQCGRGEFLLHLEVALIYRHSWPTRTLVRQAVLQYIEGFYNRNRRHTTLDGFSHAAFEKHFVIIRR